MVKKNSKYESVENEKNDDNSILPSIDASEDDIDEINSGKNDDNKNDDNNILSSTDTLEDDNDENHSGKNDDNSSDESSDELDNDIEEKKSGLTVIYEAYF